MKRIVDENGNALVRICKECNNVIGSYRYCRYCGAKAKAAEYVPYEETIQLVYGPPPIERKHTCSVCGYSWKKCLMVDRERFCPKCGGKVVIEETGGN